MGIHSIQETFAWCLRVKKEDKLSVMVWTAVCTFNEDGYDLQCILKAAEKHSLYSGCGLGSNVQCGES